MNAAIKLVEHIKTGRRYIATEALLKRGDMRAVLDGKVETVTVPEKPADDADKVPNVSSKGDTGGEANTGDGEVNAGTDTDNTGSGETGGDTDTDNIGGDTDGEGDNSGDTTGGESLADMTKAQLTKLAADYGVELNQRMKQSEMVEAVEKLIAGAE